MLLAVDARVCSTMSLEEEKEQQQRYYNSRASPTGWLTICWGRSRRYDFDGSDGAQWNRNYIKYSSSKNEYFHWILMASVVGSFHFKSSSRVFSSLFSFPAAFPQNIINSSIVVGFLQQEEVWVDEEKPMATTTEFFFFWRSCSSEDSLPGKML